MSGQPAPPPNPPANPVGAWTALPWEGLAKFGTILAALVPVAGAVERAIGYWASGRVPPSLGAVAPVAELALTGAPMLILVAGAAGLALVYLRYVRTHPDSETQAVKKAPEEEPKSARNPTQARVVDVLWWLVVAGVVMLIVLGPAWIGLAVFAMFAYGALAIYVLELSGPPTLRHLLPWAVVLTLLSGLIAGLSPQTHIAPTVEVNFSGDTSLTDGQFSLIASDERTIYLLPCRPDSRVIRVQSESVESLTYQHTPKYEITFSDMWDVIVGTDPWPQWTPLWAAVLAGQPWGLGFVQGC